MKRIRFFLFFLFILVTCSSCYSKNSYFYLIGKWEGEFYQEASSKDGYEKYELTFLPFNTLIVDITRSEEKIRGIRFSYSVYEENRVRITGRLINDFKVIAKGKDLIIEDSLTGFPPNGRYKKVIFQFQWVILIVLLVVAVLLILNCNMRRNK